MANISLTSATPRSLTCEATGLPSGATYIRWYITLPGNETSFFPFNGYTSIAMENWTYWTFTWWGDEDDPSTIQSLLPGTKYAVKISVRDINNEAIGDAITRYFTTSSAVSKWEWESEISFGEPLQITAAEFNRFIDCIFRVAELKGVSLNGSASKYYVSKGMDMLADDVNAVRGLISRLNPPTLLPGSAVTNNPITAAFFNGLKDSLNSLI